MNFKKLITVLITMTLLGSECFARSFDNEESFEFASFIRSLIETAQTANGSATCSFGDDEISKILSSQMKNFIHFSGNDKKYTACKVIYVANGEERTFRSEIAKFNHMKILTIATFDGFVEMGGMVQVQIGRRNFELILNSKEVKEAGVKLSALVTSIVINN
jgi:hypothetical protein